MERAELKPSDFAWLEDMKESGHCGEGTLECRARASRNDRIDRIVSALRAAEELAKAGPGREEGSSREAESGREDAPPDGWRPIESAPKDGTKVDLWCVPPRKAFVAGGAGRVPDCWHSIGKWWVYDDNGDDQCRTEVCNVTHWMPLPAAPSQAEPNDDPFGPPVGTEVW